MAAMVAILDFKPKHFLLCLMYKSPESFLPKIESIGLSIQERNEK